MPTPYDVIVIGSGGGTKIAGPAAESGMKVAFIEEDAVGGTCLNRGCIPSKMIIHPAETAETIRRAGRLDIRVPGNVDIDFRALVTRTSETVDATSRELRERYAASPNIDFHAGRARFVADDTVRVNETDLSAPRIFIATGTAPAVPSIPGLAGTPFMTSREALRRTDLPQRLVVIGAGYIAVELGYAYAAAGSDVHFVVRSRFLRAEDHDVAEEFERVFTRRHRTHKGYAPVAVTYADEQFGVLCRNENGDERTVSGDALLVATGVSPCTRDLGLENTGVRTDEQGFIIVDECLRTDVPGVYALGDVVGNYLFRHTVNYEGEYLVRTAFSDSPPPTLDYGPVPHAVFSHPQVAGVGQTEEQLRDAGVEYVVGKATYEDSTPGMARRSDHGFVKLLVERGSRKLLGAHIIGDEASDMIHLFIVLMKKQGTLDDLLDMIFIHPALPEVARDAARDARGALAT